jgi:hypothetical protein
LNNRIIAILIIPLISLVLIPSCREEVIAPGNPAGNVNQPISLRSGSSYTFIINAENISATVNDYSGVYSTHSQLLITLEDYSQGRVNFNIYDYSNRLVYQKLLADNIIPINAVLDGITPDIVNISFINFTGKLKIQVFSN